MSYELPWEKFILMPIGDLQAGSDGFDAKRLKEHIRYGLDIGAHFQGTGDYTDFLSPSNRRYFKNAGLYDTATGLIERWHREHMEEVKDIFKPTIGMWTGLLEGHHYYPYDDGTTSDTDLCSYLQAPFLGTCALTVLTFEDNNKHQVECMILSQHGEGGGADPLRRLMAQAPGFPQVDVFIQGHNTQIDARPKDTIWFYREKGVMRMRERRQMFVAAGGFMRGYTQGSRSAGRAAGSYVEHGMMRPTAIGGPIIEIAPQRHHSYNGLQIRATVGDLIV